MRPHLSLGPRELEVSPEDSGCATIPLHHLCSEMSHEPEAGPAPPTPLPCESQAPVSSTCQTRGLPPPSCCCRPGLSAPASLSPWGLIRRPPHMRSVTACMASTITSLPPRHSRGSSLRTSETHPSPQGSPFPSSPGHPAVYTQAMLQLP